VAAVGGSEYGQVRSAAELKSQTWFYDQARNNLHIRTNVGAKEDRVVNVYSCQGW
jgi:hypothetical protein